MATADRSDSDGRLLRRKQKKRGSVYHHESTAKSTEAFIKRMQAPRLAKSVSFSPGSEPSWRKSKLSAAMAVEREQVNEKHRRSHQQYGSRYRNTAAYFAQLDFHSTKLEDKYRELKELMSDKYLNWPHDVVLKEARGVLRSLRVLPNEVTSPAPGDAGAPHYFQPELPSRVGEKCFACVLFILFCR